MAARPSFSDLCAGLLRGGDAVRFTATGASMAPAIRHGDRLTVVPARASEVRLGDVVLYVTPRGLTAHRVVKALSASGEHLEMRGDAPRSQTERVPGTAVLGRVTRVERAATSAESGVRARARAWLLAALARLRTRPARVSTVDDGTPADIRPQTGRHGG